MSDSVLTKRGFNVENGNIILQTKYNQGKQLVVYVSGGSTTDPAVIRQNWPISLIQLFDEYQINAKIIIGAVGGYNSGQELLKLMQYDYNIEPDIFISYSGANELEPSYVAYVEEQLFENTAHSNYLILPNTITLLRKVMRMDNTAGSSTIVKYFKEILKVYPTGDEVKYAKLVADFWLRNMQTMNAIRQSKGGTFIGILQPLQGGSTYTQKNTAPYAGEMITHYKKYYPSLAKICASNPSFLVDFKNIFDGIKDEVYTDDCHLKPAYQKLVAQKIYSLLLDRNLVHQPN